jgi:putative NADH-flavin reductase
MSRRRVLVLGATGGTGRALVVQAPAGYEVTVLVRDSARLPSGIDVTRVVTADLVAQPDRLRDALCGQDAVVSALGVGQRLRPHGLMAQVAPLLVKSMLEVGVRRLVFTSAFGVGATRPDLPLLPRFLTATLLRRIYTDKEEGEKAIIESDLDWTLVCPVGLSNGVRTGRYRVGPHLRLRGFPRISRADVADCLWRQVQQTNHLRQRVLVAP